MRDKAVRGAELCAGAELRSVRDPQSERARGERRCSRSAPVAGDGFRGGMFWAFYIGRVVSMISFFFLSQREGREMVRGLLDDYNCYHS